MPGGYVGGRPKDESKLSRDPRQVRIRLRRAAKTKRGDGRINRDLAMLHRPIEDFDFEELARGRPRDKNGNFSGSAPKWITPHIQMEMKRRLVSTTYGLLARELHQAVRVMAELMISDEVDMNGKPIVDAKTRFAAAAFIIEHLIGKPNAMIKLDATIDEPRAALAAAIVLDDGQPQGHLTIDGEVAEDEEVEDDADGQ